MARGRGHARTAGKTVLRAGLLSALLAAMAAAVPAQAPALDAAQAFAESEAALGRSVDGAGLLDRDGRPVSLARYRGKPLLVSFVYTGCFQACPTGTRRLAEAVRTANGTLGAGRYNVVSIGFNAPADSPQAMKAFAAQHRIDEPNWDFLSAPGPAVAPLTRTFGFMYQPTPAGIDHLLLVSLVDAQGRIVRQVQGDSPGVQAIVEPLKQLLRNEPLPPRPGWADLVERVRLLCTVYDPATGSYRTSYALAIEVAGGVTFLAAMAWFFLAEWRARRRLPR